MRQKQTKTSQRISQTMKVLLDAYAGLYWATPQGRGYAYFYRRMERDARRYEEKQRKRALYELRRRKLIEVNNKGGRLIVALTEKGLAASLPYRMKNASQCPNNAYVVVTFDIPEARRDVRWCLRHLLKENEFQMLHRSVWYTNRDVLDLLREWVRKSQAEPWVYVFRATDITVEQPNKKK